MAIPEVSIPKAAMNTQDVASSAGESIKVTLDAEREIAFDSPDHLVPWGTRHDSFVNSRFNKRLWWLHPVTGIVKVLDLGCAGGEFVRSCINDGHFGIGLEGSDWSKRHKRAAWALNSDALFTCDITRPFTLRLGQMPLRFDVVTAWEVIEHIKEIDLPILASNVHAHLAPGGLWILSITNQEDVVGGVRLHQTVRPKAWWRQRLESLGFHSADKYVRYFSGQFVRGGKTDNDINFRLVLTNDPSKTPAIPRLPLANRLFDKWIGSRPQRIINKLVVG